MARSNSARLERLERVYQGSGSDEVRRLVERIEAEEGFAPGELLAEVERVMAEIGPPLTMERVTRYYAAETGCTVAELMADAARLAERYP
jgi:hypothetical protein